MRSTDNKNEFHVVDILSDDKDAPLTESQGLLLRESLTTAILAADDISSLLFEHSGFVRGRFRMTCTNTTSRDWVFSTLRTLKGLWRNAKIQAVYLGHPPKLVRSTIFVKHPIPSDLIETIGKQNESIDTSHWRVFKRNKIQDGKQLCIVGVDENSIPGLRELNFQLKIGSGKTKIVVENENE